MTTIVCPEGAEEATASAAIREAALQSQLDKVQQSLARSQAQTEQTQDVVDQQVQVRFPSFVFTPK